MLPNIAKPESLIDLRRAVYGFLSHTKYRANFSHNSSLGYIPGHLHPLVRRVFQHRCVNRITYFRCIIHQRNSRKVLHTRFSKANRSPAVYRANQRAIKRSEFLIKFVDPQSWLRLMIQFQALGLITRKASHQSSSTFLEPSCVCEPRYERYLNAPRGIGHFDSVAWLLAK